MYMASKFSSILYWGDHHQYRPSLLILSLWFIDAPGFKDGNPLNITLIQVPYFIVIAGLGSISSSSLEYYKERSFVFL